MKTVRNKAWEYYKRWRKEETFSPALNKKIRISLKGWYHITGEKGLKKRSVNDAYRRMKLLSTAKRIIKKSTTLQDVSTRNGVKYYALESFERDRRVKVILVEDKNKNVVFYSVMDRKRKRRNVSPVSDKRKGRGV